MMGILLTLAFIPLCAPGSQQTQSWSLEETATHMANFYSTPTQIEFDMIQRGLESNLHELEAKGNAADTLASVFLATVHAKHGWPIRDLGSLDDGARSIERRDGTPLSKYVDDDHAIDPGKLDIWWIEFFATEDTQYLDKLVAQIGDVKAQSGVNRILITGAANWSFAANCRQHPIVLRHAKHLLSLDPPLPNKKALQEVVARAERPNG